MSSIFKRGHMFHSLRWSLYLKSIKNITISSWQCVIRTYEKKKQKQKNITNCSPRCRLKEKPPTPTPTSPKPCSKDEFTCDNGNCVPTSKVWSIFIMWIISTNIFKLYLPLQMAINFKSLHIGVWLQQWLQWQLRWINLSKWEQLWGEVFIENNENKC